VNVIFGLVTLSDAASRGLAAAPVNVMAGVLIVTCLAGAVCSAGFAGAAGFASGGWIGEVFVAGFGGTP
jgi:hypothetical protein